MDIDKGTKGECERLLAMGMVEITPEELVAKLADLGYDIEPEETFDYDNRSNAIHYRARSVAIRHKASGLSFAHIHCDRSKLAELQQLRLYNFVFAENRIWEL